VKLRALPTRAFTLIEMVISGALMCIILASAYVCMSAGFSSQRTIDARSDATQSARVAISMMAADLRCAVPLSKDFEFVGMHRELEGDTADNLDFATRNYIPQKSYEPDYCEVSYFVQRDPANGTLTLFRRRDPTPDPEPFKGGSREEIARGLLGLHLEYYDGYDWFDEWGDPSGKKKLSAFPDPNVSGLPESVRITINVDPSFEHRHGERDKSGEPPVTFQTVARIPMASFFYYRSSSSGGSTNSTSGAQPDVQQPNPQQGGVQ
jgi:type II secretory pathway pseudopilin PulG